MNPELSHSIPTPTDEQRQFYFVRLAKRMGEPLKLHSLPLHPKEGQLQGGGLWETFIKPDGSKDVFANVTAHCLLETARAEEFADLLSFPADLKMDLMTSAVVHDFYKRGETEKAAGGQLSLKAAFESSDDERPIMEAAGISERAIEITEILGDIGTKPAHAIALKPDLTPLEEALLVMRYLDDYTINANWAIPAGSRDDGSRVNDLDRRIDKNEANPRYRQLNEEGREYFDGLTAYQAQRRMGHAVQTRLADLINQRNDTSLDPLDLPEYVDNLVKARICAVSV